jgi:hypothetical protein
MGASIAEEVGAWRTAEAARKVRESEWLVVAQVSELVQLPTKTIRFQISTGVVRAYRFGSSQQLRVAVKDPDRTVLIG